MQWKRFDPCPSHCHPSTLSPLFWGIYCLGFEGVFFFVFLLLFAFCCFYLVCSGFGFFCGEISGLGFGWLFGVFFDIQMNPNMWSMLTLLAPWCVKMWRASSPNSVGLGDEETLFLYSFSSFTWRQTLKCSYLSSRARGKVGVVLATRGLLVTNPILCLPYFNATLIFSSL